MAEQKFCSDCGAANSTRAAFCANCGKTFTSASLKKSDSTEDTLTSNTQFKFCKNCGRKVSLNGQLCARCGADLSEQQVVRSSRDPTTQKASATARVTKETAPTQQRLTAKEWLDKGRALAKSGRHQDALQCFDKAHTIDLTDADALVLKGIELNALGRYREALQCFDNTLTTDPKNAFAQESKKVALETIRKTTPQKERAIVSTQVTLKSSTNKFALPSFCPCCGGRPAYTPVKKQTTLSVGSRGMATVTRYLNWSYYVCAQCAVHDKVKKQRGEGRFYAFVPVILFSWGAVNVVFGWSLASNVGAGDIPGLIAGIFVYILIYLLVGRVYNPEKHKTPTCATMGSPVKMDKSRTYTFAREDYGTEFARLNQESVNDKRTRYKS